MSWLKKVLNRAVTIPVKRLIVGGIVGVSIGALGVSLTDAQTDVLITALVTLWS